jgi:hypothetical protein
MVRAHTPALALDPLRMFPDERLRFATRSAARDGHAQRAVRAHAQDVPPGPAHAHELDAVVRRGRFLGRRLRCDISGW